MKLKGVFSFKTGDISLCLNDSGRNPGKRKNDDTGKRIDSSMEMIGNGDNEREEIMSSGVTFLPIV